ncbi:LysR substrate-binding domain-containing protein [Vibrio salinus]|uniref:LysR substrate-binding domain-containing protein n=1 Tax=Vibrio salinus TaxID=2899784 RepID=UPI001E5053AA|nr:LysR substrate-binding domain-containing protein [Vibrio salinus]MCE0494719.1 LysR substrate-binding domain-containing protein [Vibrio salinus]
MRHLKAFHVFHITAGSSSYSEAAGRLHITHGAVSKQIKLLESHLSLTLFYKQGRRMCLTQEGELLKHYTDIAFNTLESGVKKLTQEHRRYLEISCEPTLTMRWLMPRLSLFFQHTGIDIRLSTAGGAISLDKTGLSLAIRRDDFDINPEYTVSRLVPEWVGPVLSPQYWNKVKNTPEMMVFLHSETRPLAWKEWATATQQKLTLNQSSQSFGHFYFCLQAATDGLGAAIGSYPLVVDDLKNGRLIAPFGFVRSGHHYVLLSHNEKPEPNELIFLNWLQKTMALCQPDQNGC